MPPPKLLVCFFYLKHSKNVACVASDMSVIQIGRTFLKDGIRHRCNVQGDTATYEQSY